MSNTITVSALATLLSEKTSYKLDFCKLFISEVFKAISEGLKDSSEVKVKGLGSFSKNENNQVIFIPDPDVAALVNEPFGFFEPVELDDDIDEKALSDDNTETSEDLTTIKESSPEVESTIESIPVTEVSIEEQQDEEEKDTDSEPTELPTSADTPEDIPEETPNHEISDEEKDSEKNTDLSVAKDEVYKIPDDNAYDSYNENPTNINGDNQQTTADDSSLKLKIKFLNGFIIGLIVGVIIGAGAIIAYNCLSSPVSPSDKEKKEASDSIKDTSKDIVKANEQSPNVDVKDLKSSTDTDKNSEAVLDTITPKNFLTRMARKHYKIREYWVYIYEENADKIGDPQTVPPNTIVVIPPLEKYGITDPNNPESISKAKKKAYEIYTKYRK